MKNFSSVTFAENIENEETSVVTEHENDIYKSYCGIRRLYKKSKSLLHTMTSITWYDEVKLFLDLIPQNLRPRGKCLQSNQNFKVGSDFHVIF